MTDLKFLKRKALLEPGRLTPSERRLLQAEARVQAAAARCLAADSVAARLALKAARENQRNLQGTEPV